MYFKRRVYNTYEPIDEVRARIKDFSSGFFTGPNLSPKEIEKDLFIITQKYSITLFYGSPAVIEAKLIEKENSTIINVLFRITYQAITAQIFFCCFFLYGCFQLRSDMDKALMCLFPSLLGLFFVHIFHNIALKRIQKLFEQALGII